MTNVQVTDSSSLPWALGLFERLGVQRLVYKLMLLVPLAFVPVGANAQSCTTTLSVGQNLASAVSSAANGSVICLNSGSWGSVNLSNIRRGGYVTVKSASAKGAQIAPQVGNSTYIKFDSLTISSFVLQNSCSTNIHWLNNVFDGRQFTLSNSGCGNLATVIDGNSFRNYSVGGGFEGRLSLAYGSGISVTNNYFGDGGASDGIQLVGGVSNVNISGNTFSGILATACGSVHCDSIQIYGAGSGIVIEKNLFKNSDVFIMAPDGSSGVQVRNNVFDGSGVAYDFKIQFGSASNLVFEHNTLKDASVAVDSKTGMSASSNAIVRNNVLVGRAYFKTTGGNGCSNCSFAYNMFDNSGDASGSSNLIGVPTFSGGSAPTAWAGWKLTSGSAGTNAASDGLDVGTTYYGSGNSSVLAAPTNLRIN
jgi:hypothetical protein